MQNQFCIFFLKQ